MAAFSQGLRGFMMTEASLHFHCFRRKVRRLQVPKHPRMKRKQRIPPRRQRKCPSQRWMKMQHKVYAFWYLNRNSSAGGW